ncbi:MAG TPA: hypothetical protein VLC98_09025 [Phnomibacter sp.]|nr:hypothetical protein [Phnomibacter sp.]
MKKAIICLACIGFMLASCASSKKRGCPSGSANMGAERVLAGEKPEKSSKFKVKNMN